VSQERIKWAGRAQGNNFNESLLLTTEVNRQVSLGDEEAMKTEPIFPDRIASAI
jgi:hypothetical protein